MSRFFLHIDKFIYLILNAVIYVYRCTFIYRYTYIHFKVLKQETEAQKALLSYH